MVRRGPVPCRTSPPGTSGRSRARGTRRRGASSSLRTYPPVPQQQLLDFALTSRLHLRKNPTTAVLNLNVPHDDHVVLLGEVFAQPHVPQLLRAPSSLGELDLSWTSSWTGTPSWRGPRAASSAPECLPHVSCWAPPEATSDFPSRRPGQPPRSSWENATIRLRTSPWPRSATCWTTREYIDRHWTSCFLRSSAGCLNSVRVDHFPSSSRKYTSAQRRVL